MRKLRFVGDGLRDAKTAPPLVKGILKADFEHEATAWPRLHTWEKKVSGFRLKGYGRKLLFVLRGARDERFDGVVATVDTDTTRRGERLASMKQARDADRSTLPPLPAALGEASPHNEAWLLDDAVAVREGLSLPIELSIPSVRGVLSPKDELERLHQASPRSDGRPLDVWAAIAAYVDEHRCNHRAETGFEAFARDIRAELGPLFAAAG